MMNEPRLIPLLSPMTHHCYCSRICDSTNKSSTPPHHVGIYNTQSYTARRLRYTSAMFLAADKSVRRASSVIVISRT